MDARRLNAPSFAKELQVTETTGGLLQSAQTRSRLHRVITSRQSRWLFVIAILVGIGGYVVGLNIAYLDIAAARQAIQTLRADNQKLKTQISDQNATQVALQISLQPLKPRWKRSSLRRILMTSSQTNP